jgi:protein-S-isoprenylcysteine O-methyltransferase Ste14
MVFTNINILTILSIIIWFLIFLYWIVRSKNRGILNEILGLIKLLFSGLILHVPTFFSFNFLAYNPSFKFQIIGLSVILFGLVVSILGREFLSSNWSGKVIIQEKHELIKKGPYKIIRHPIYSGGLIMMIGSSTIIGNILCFIWVLFCLFGLFKKSKQEEELLINKFGETYKQYKKETKMMIPYIL